MNNTFENELESNKEKKIHNKISGTKGIFFFISGALLLLYAISIIGPLLWSLMNSLKTERDFMISVFSFPSSIRWLNFKEAADFLALPLPIEGGGTRSVMIVELFYNTIIYSVGSTIFATISPCITAYAVAKYRFKLKGLIYNLVIITMLLPIVGSLPAQMLLMRSIHFYDNMIGIWITHGSFLGMNFLIFYATFKSLSWEYAEAGFIDGASHFRVMVQIMFPLVRTTFMAIALLAFIGLWNDYQTQLIYLPSYPSISYALFQIQFNTNNGASAIPIKMAGCMIVSIPIFILFMFTKKLLIGNLAVGGIKG